MKEGRKEGRKQKRVVREERSYKKTEVCKERRNRGVWQVEE